MKPLLTLKTNSLPGDIDIHSDLLSVLPSALSRKRALKAGREKQKRMQDSKGAGRCLLCDPAGNKPPGSSPCDIVIANRVADFVNDFPYLPADQRVLFLWHNDKSVRQAHLHRFRLRDLRRMELYWLVRGCIVRGEQYRSPNPKKHGDDQAPDLLRRAPDLMRMVVGFNLGGLAGQSIPHFHVQYGWEVVLNPRSFSPSQLQLYFEELVDSDLIIWQNDQVRIVAPWTPMGQFAIDLYFVGKYDICDLSDDDLKVFATFGHAIIQKYISLGIQNLNVVFTNSPDKKQIEPLVVHFVPRVNMTALYEIKGVNVVDTPPAKIAEEFRRVLSTGKEEINWSDLLKVAHDYNPDKEFLDVVRSSKKKGRKTVEKRRTKKR